MLAANSSCSRVHERPRPAFVPLPGALGMFHNAAVINV